MILGTGCDVTDPPFRLVDKGADAFVSRESSLSSFKKNSSRRQSKPFLVSFAFFTVRNQRRKSDSNFNSVNIFALTFFLNKFFCNIFIIKSKIIDFISQKWSSTF